jgi:hypothetical protein
MRDLVSGIAIVLAPAGGVLLAGAVHAGAFDVGDAAVFGRLLPAAAARRKIRGHGAGLGHSAGALDDLSERLTAASP